MYSCGQYDKKEKTLNLSVLDFGPGIVENVKKHRNSPQMDGIEALEWALQRGNSTRTDSKGIDMPRGLGFDLLNEFINLNQGELHIYSNDVKAISIGRGKYNVQKMESHLPGTLVSIKINCDNQSYYRFASEPSVSTVNYY